MSAIIDSISKKVRDESFIPFVVLLGACILVALGSSRIIISPLGYWLLWSALVVTGLLDSRTAFSTLFSDKSFRALSLGFGVLVFGFVVSALHNQDRYTLFQGVKFVFIYLAFVSVYSCSKKLADSHLIIISKITICVAFLMFSISKMFFKDWHVVLGDGREGSKFAYPGVLWKTTIFFLGFSLIGLIKGRLALSEVAILILSIYLLFMDSSRTGFLWGAVTSLAILIKGRPNISRRKIQWFWGGVTLVTIFLVVYSRLLNEVNGAGAAIFQRMYTVDNARIQLLADGVERAQECFIFGCGFGSASSFIMGENVKIHNAYIGSLADLGILGLTGLMILILQPIKIFRSTLEWEKNVGNCDILAWIAVMGVLGYGFTMTLHPLSSELSEWGIWIVMVSWLSTLCVAKIQQADNQRPL